MVREVVKSSWLCKYEVLSSNPEHLCKKLGMATHSCNPELVRGDR